MRHGSRKSIWGSVERWNKNRQRLFSIPLSFCKRLSAQPVLQQPCLRLVDAGIIHLFVSKEIFFELEQVLSREKENYITWNERAGLRLLFHLRGAGRFQMLRLAPARFALGYSRRSA